MESIPLNSTTRKLWQFHFYSYFFSHFKSEQPLYVLPSISKRSSLLEQSKSIYTTETKTFSGMVEMMDTVSNGLEWIGALFSRNDTNEKKRKRKLLKNVRSENNDQNLSSSSSATASHDQCNGNTCSVSLSLDNDCVIVGWDCLTGKICWNNKST